MFHPRPPLVSNVCFCLVFFFRSLSFCLLTYVLSLLTWFTAYDQLLCIFILFWLISVLWILLCSSSFYVFCPICFVIHSLIAYSVFSNVSALRIKTLPIHIFVIHIHTHSYICNAKAIRIRTFFSICDPFIYTQKSHDSDSKLSRWRCSLQEQYCVSKQGACKNVIH